MSIQFSKLVPEMMRQRFPSRSEQPDRRAKAAEIVRVIKRDIGGLTISRWEFSRAGTVILYFGVIHHEPNMNRQILPRILKASERFNFPFRMFADGNQIGMEILSKI